MVVKSEKDVSASDSETGDDGKQRKVTKNGKTKSKSVHVSKKFRVLDNFF